jgi:MOSC domain-containing protein YiiM
MEIAINSESVGEAERFLSLADLEAGLAGMGAAPRDRGAVLLVLRKLEGGQRDAPVPALLTPGGGVVGDVWGRRDHPNPEAQITVMQTGVARLIANGQPLPLFGDNLYVDLDLSNQNLPTGSRVRVGKALLEVTPMPHNGCQKFKLRFGQEALNFVSKKDLRHLNLRGIYMQVIEAGEVRPGDLVKVLQRR